MPPPPPKQTVTKWQPRWGPVMAERRGAHWGRKTEADLIPRPSLFEAHVRYKYMHLIAGDFRPNEAIQ